MSREEAIDIIKCLAWHTRPNEEDIEQAIKALEQEPKTDVLDKIRAEIEQITDTMGVSYNRYISKIDVLQIIDKYRAESEDKE